MSTVPALYLNDVLDAFDRLPLLTMPLREAEWFVIFML